MPNRPLPPVSALSPAALFFDVDGIPVSLGEPLAGKFSAAWAQDPPRRFAPELGVAKRPAGFAR